jgi:hypothetical protein
MVFSRAGGVTGSRAGLRIRFRKEWGFESPLAHFEAPRLRHGLGCATKNSITTWPHAKPLGGLHPK